MIALKAPDHDLLKEAAADPARLNWQSWLKLVMAILTGLSSVVPPGGTPPAATKA